MREAHIVFALDFGVAHIIKVRTIAISGRIYYVSSAWRHFIIYGNLAMSLQPFRTCVLYTFHIKYVKGLTTYTMCRLYYSSAAFTPHLTYLPALVHSPV